MKKILSTTVIALTLFSCSLAIAKTVTIDWTMSDTSNVTGYKMYYSYSSNMDNKLLACETTNPDITSLSCPNITFTSPISYWTIGAVTNTGELESIPKLYDATLMKVQNFAVLTPGANSPPTALIASNITSGSTPVTISFDGTGSHDSDGTIVSYVWDFGDGFSGSGNSINHTYSSAGSYNVFLTVTDDRGGTGQDQFTITANEPDLGGSTYAINFQPAYAPIPDGFVLDSGLAFDPDRGYGWTQLPPAMQLKDRDSNISPDQNHDTNITFVPPGTWELTLPNGVYEVTIAVGDAWLAVPYVQNVQAEGIMIVDKVQLIHNATNWYTNTTDVEVTDGRLTLTFDGSTEYAKLCWITIN